jgi:hypothetical protein
MTYITSCLLVSCLVGHFCPTTRLTHARRLAVEKWKAGDRYPANSKAVISLLEKMEQKKRIPKKRRYSTRR